MGDFDEYEYLEKTVEDSKIRSKKDDVIDGEKRERSHRKRDGVDGEEREKKWRRSDGEERENSDDVERRRKKSRRSDGEERERERERRREKEKERERREREKSKEREKERERSRSRRHESREREKEAELRDRESRRFKEKKEAVEPEADPERDQRTVFAYQMPLKATERDVYEFFSKAGKVRDVRLIMDRNSRRSKGVGNAIKISMMRNDGNTLLSC